jgi:hypothetical protein
MQPPPPVPIAPNEPSIVAPSTTYTQLIAVPIPSDSSNLPIATTTPTNKQSKRVCILFLLNAIEKYYFFLGFSIFSKS